MSTIIIVAVVFGAFGLGYIVAGILAANTNSALRDTITTQDKDAEELRGRITLLQNALNATDRALGRAMSELARLTPLAEHGQKMKDSQRRASEASAAAQAAKKASNVTSIAGAKPVKFTPPRKAHPKRRAKA